MRARSISVVARMLIRPESRDDRTFRQTACPLFELAALGLGGGPGVRCGGQRGGSLVGGSPELGRLGLSALGLFGRLPGFLQPLALGGPQLLHAFTGGFQLTTAIAAFVLGLCPRPLGRPRRREARERVESRGLELLRQPAAFEQLAALGAERRGAHRLHRALDDGGAGTLALGELARRRGQPLERMLLLAARLGELLRGAASLARGQRLAGLQEPLDVERTLAGQTVDEPDGESRLAQALDLVRQFAVPVGSQALRSLVASRGELAERQLVEAVELSGDFLLRHRVES